MIRNMRTSLATCGLLILAHLAIAGEFEIRYDDGTCETGYYGVSAGDGYAVRFTAPCYPCTVLAGMYFVADAGNPTVPFQAVVLDDGGPGGAPGSALATVDFVSADTGNIWVEVELPDTSTLVLIHPTSFYVAMYWYTSLNPSLGGDLQFGGGDTLSWRFYSGIWYNLGGLVDLMIRAVVTHPDTSPPRFSETTLLRDTTSCGPFRVSSIITDDWVGVDPLTTFIFWSTTTRPWDSVSMFSVGGDTFGGEMGILPEGDSIRYYLSAKDLARNRSTDPPDAPDSSLAFLIIAEPPQFSGTTVWPDTSLPGPYPVVTSIWDNGAGLDTTSIHLYWRFDEGDWSDTSMTWYGGAQRAYAQIPEVPNPAETTAVRYYIEAYDLIGLRGTDPSGAPDESTHRFLYRPPVGVETEETGDSLQLTESLSSFPNPFVSTTAIRYCIPEANVYGPGSRHVTLAIYDLAGKLTATLVSEPKQSGFHRVIWDGADANGRPVPAGVYFCRLQVGHVRREQSRGMRIVKKIVVLR